MSYLNNKTVQQLINTLPYYAKNQNNLDKILQPINALTANLNQSVVNALVSQYDQTLPYCILKNKTSMPSLRPMIPHSGNNLVLNIRAEFGENAARYCFGYKPEISNDNSTTHKNKYFIFSDIVPTTRNPNLSDYIYVDSSCYDTYIHTEELQKLVKNNIEPLLTLPLVLKYWDHLSNFFSDGEALKENILSDLKKNDCMKYYNHLSNFKTTFYSMPSIDIEDLDKDESFYMLLAYFLEEHYNIDHNQLKNEEIGRLMFKVVGDSDFNGLNSKFPPILNTDLSFKPNYLPKEAQFKNVLRPKNPPPPPPINKNQKTDNIILSEQKIYLDKPELKNPNIIYDSLKDVIKEANGKFNSVDINGIKKQGMSLFEELKEKIKDRFIGGHSYKEDGTDMTEIDVGAFPDTELEYLKAIVPRLSGPKPAKLNSIEELKYRLFSKACVGNFVNTPMFMKRLKELYDILSQNNHYFLEYNFKEYDIETFVLKDNNNNDNAIKAYVLYFEILKGIVLGMREKTSVANIPKENLVFIGLSIVVMLNNFGYYVFGDLIALRHYIDGFYTLVKRLNMKEVPVVSLYTSINTTIGDFLEKINVFFGGSNNNYAFDYKQSFNFFQHSYLMDIMRSHKLGVVSQPKYLSSSMNDDPLALFWDGVSLTKVYNTFSLEKKYLYSVMYKTYFISTCQQGTKLKSSYKEVTSTHSKSENARAIFVAEQLSNTCSHQEMLAKLTERVMKDITSEINIETLANELEKIFGADVIRSMDKLKIVDEPSKVPIFVKIVENKKLNNESPTILESLMFLFVMLEKLGFSVKKSFAKTNMVLQIQPELIKENIREHLGDSLEQRELNEYFIEKYGSLLENLLNKSLVSSGGSAENKTTVIVSLPITSDLKSDIDITKENVEKVFLGNNNPISKEVSDLQQGVTLMLNSNTMTEDVLYRLVPYYVKEQLKLVIDTPEINEIGGVNDTIENDIITLFLEKVDSISNIKTSEPMTPEELSRSVDKFLKESYIKSVDHLIPFYDNKISVGNGKDRSYTLIKYTLDTINYLRNNMKIDFDDGFKRGIVSIIKIKQQSDEYCYKIFIIVQYIRHMIEELYNRLRIQPNTRTITFNEFNKFFKIVVKKINEKDEKLKKLFDQKTKNYINQKLNAEFKLEEDNKIFEQRFLDLFDKNKPTAKLF